METSVEKLPVVVSYEHWARKDIECSAQWTILGTLEDKDIEKKADNGGLVCEVPEESKDPIRVIYC